MPTDREIPESKSEDYNNEGAFEQTAEQQWFKTGAARLLAEIRPRIPIPTSAVPLSEEDEASLSSEPTHVEYSAVTKANDGGTGGAKSPPLVGIYAEVEYNRFSRLALQAIEKHGKNSSLNSVKQKTALQNNRPMSNSSTGEKISSSYITVSTGNVALEESQAIISA